MLHDNMSKSKSEGKTRRPIIAFILSRSFLKNLAGIIALFIVVGLITTLWLRMYTHHGQELELPDYQGMDFADAEADGKANKFKLQIKDSIHVVGQSGGKILQQDPPPFSKVKEGRSIYVTITKNEPDQIPITRLPNLYGENYDRKKRELVEHFEIRSKVVGKEYDPGVPGQILEVRYNGKVIINRSGRTEGVSIEKGGMLEFIISERSGGSVEIPDIVCQEYAAAKFLLESIGLYIGDITYGGAVTNLETAYVISQNPRAADGNIERGSAVSVEVSDEKPIDCNNE
jgi:beta-lactam-binding protein with PASTA domain